MILNWLSASFVPLFESLGWIKTPPYDNGVMCLYSENCKSEYCSWGFICEEPEAHVLTLLAKKDPELLPIPANTTMVDTRKLALAMMPFTGNDAGQFQDMVRFTGLHDMEHHVPAHVIK